MTMLSMKLGGEELACLLAVITLENPRVSAIATAIHAHASNVSRALRTLMDKGFLTTNKVGPFKTISLSESKHATLWRMMARELGHMPLEKLLAGTGLDVLSAICSLNLRNRKDIAEATLVSERSVAVVLEKLKHVGMIQKVENTYAVSPRFMTLKEFVIEYRHYLNQRTALEFASDAIIMWESNIEFLIHTKSQRTSPDFHLTGVSRFPRFGIPLLAPASYFFYSPLRLRLKLEDAIFHSLLVPRRNILPTLLVWKKHERSIDIGYIESQVEFYGTAESVKQIQRYFATNGRERAPDFPPWAEFAQRAREYGIV